MKNYKFEITYDGSRYFGWERQPDQETIQGKIEKVLSLMTDAPVELIGAGRTDAGVHAKKMTANAHMETTLTPKEIQSYMNHYLPDDISINEVTIASDRFHARYNAVGKLYIYTCYVGELKPVFTRKYMTVLDFMPDVEQMQKAAEYLKGTHDYCAFCSNPRMKKSTVRTVDSIEINLKKDLLTFAFHGDGFLQNMVRILVGTLLEVGKGNLPPEEMPKIIMSKNRQNAGPTAPPQGLCLHHVDY